MKRRGTTPIPWAVAGAISAMALCWTFGNRFVAPEPANPKLWSFVVPNHSGTKGSAQESTSAQVQSGAMTLHHIGSRGSDIMRPANSAALGRVDITLREGTERLQLVFRGENGSDSVIFRFDHDAWAVTGRAGYTPHKSPGEWNLIYDNGTWYLDELGRRTALGRASPGSFELTTIDGDVDIESVRLTDLTGATIVDENYRTGGLGGPALAGSGIGGAMAGLLAAKIMPIWLRTILLGLPALAAVLPTSWIGGLTERFYLTQTSPTQIRFATLVVATLPLILTAVVASGILKADRQSSPKSWMKRLFPGLLLLGTGYTAWIGVAYAMLVIAANAKGMPSRRAKQASDAFFVLCLAFPLTLEWAVRSTYLEEAWDAARLAGESAETVDWRDPMPFWQGDCGPSTVASRKTITFMGGSSSGGAYQFSNEPQAFFPAQTHQRLCDSLDASASLRTLNFGHGGRDSFTVSRSIATVLKRRPADLVVFYGGCNDILTSTNALTRKQREEKALAGGAAVGFFARSVGYSRLITGFSLPFHSTEAPGGELAPEVPLADAEENLVRLAEATKAAGAKLLLMTELVSGGDRGMMATYDHMQAKVADRFDHVSHFNVSNALAPYESENLLIDRNHFNVNGAKRFAEVLSPVVAGILGLSGGVELPASVPVEPEAIAPRTTTPLNLPAEPVSPTAPPTGSPAPGM